MRAACSHRDGGPDKRTPATCRYAAWLPLAVRSVLLRMNAAPGPPALSRRLFSRLSLRQWLTLPYVLLVCAVALVIAALSYRTGSDAVDTVARHLLIETVERIGQAVDRHVVGSAAVLEAAFPSGMAAADRIETDLPALRTRLWIATSLHLDPNNYVYYGNRHGQFFGLWRFDANEAELRLKLAADQPRTLARFSGIGGVPVAPTTEQRMYEPRARPWYKAGQESTEHTWTAIYIDFRTGELIATRARRVLDASGALQGVVATDLSLRRLNEFVRSLTLSPRAVAFIIEPDGKLIASSRSANVARQADASNARINAADSDDAMQRAAYAQVRSLLAAGNKLEAAATQRFTGPQGEAVELAVSHVRDVAGLDWLAVVAVPRSDFMQGVTANVQRTALIGALAALVAVALGLALVEWVGRDLRQLTRAARAVGEGHLETPLTVNRADEIGELASAFRQMQQRLRIDHLTGLVNRDVILRGIGDRVQRAGRRGDHAPFAVLFVDLNNFKLVNDRFGHDAGDRTLIEVGQRLRRATRAGDLVARYAGDEFVLLITDIPSRDAAEQVRAHVEAALREPLVSVDLSALASAGPTGGAVGLALYPGDGDSAEALIASADEDMYARKRQRAG